MRTRPYICTNVNYLFSLFSLLLSICSAAQLSVIFHRWGLHYHLFLCNILQFLYLMLNYLTRRLFLSLLSLHNIYFKNPPTNAIKNKEDSINTLISYYVILLSHIYTSNQHWVYIFIVIHIFTHSHTLFTSSKTTVDHERKNIYVLWTQHKRYVEYRCYCIMLTSAETCLLKFHQRYHV